MTNVGETFQEPLKNAPSYDWSIRLIRLVRHKIGPTYDWSVIRLVRLVHTIDTIGPSYDWPDIRLVRHAIGLTYDWSIRLVHTIDTIGPSYDGTSGLLFYDDANE